MKVAVFGLGYVGAVTAAVLADQGHSVIGVDPVESKVNLIRSGRSPVVEPGLGELIRRVTSTGQLRATTDPDEGMMDADLSVICVGTPSLSNGGLELRYVHRAARDIGLRLSMASPGHTVVVRSTMLPGSMEGTVIPTIEEAAGDLGVVGAGVVFHPEFLREGSSLRDYADPPYIVVGASDPRHAQSVLGLYEDIDADKFVVPFKEAELVKYASNAFHALKVVFANEIGNLAAAQGMDGRDVMHILVQDTKLNISPAYLKPGYAFGGSCLPKDLRALRHHARDLNVDTAMLDSLLPSNAGQVERAYELVAAGGRRSIGVLGMSFKSETDDLRESPVVSLIERLIGRGFPVRVYDPNVALADLIGSNKAYIQAEIPHFASLMAESAESAVSDAEVVVVAGRAPQYLAALESLPADVDVVDLVGIARPPRTKNYTGICW